MDRRLEQEQENNCLASPIIRLYLYFPLSLHIQYLFTHPSHLILPMSSNTISHFSTAQTAGIAIYDLKYPLPIITIKCSKKKKCCKKYKKEKRCKDCPKKAKH